MVSLVTSRYAVALIDLAQGAGVTRLVEQDLQALASMLVVSPDLAALVCAPSVHMQGLEGALLALADRAKFQTLTKNFLGVLIRNRRINLLSPMIEAAQIEISRQRGEVSVEVQTATKLSTAQAKTLNAVLAKHVGHAVNIQARVEPAILGGMIVTVGSHRVDDSVRRKLERLKGAMSAQANQNTQTTTPKTKEAK